MNIHKIDKNQVKLKLSQSICNSNRTNDWIICHRISFLNDKSKPLKWHLICSIAFCELLFCMDIICTKQRQNALHGKILDRSISIGWLIKRIWSTFIPVMRFCAKIDSNEMCICFVYYNSHQSTAFLALHFCCSEWEHNFNE